MGKAASAAAGGRPRQLAEVLPDLGAIDPRWHPPRWHLPRADVDRWINPDDGEHYRKRARALRAAQVKQAQADFPTFLQYCFRDDRNMRPLEVQWYQEEWSAAMDTYDRLMIVAPRNHGKTTIMTARVLWELGRDPDLRIKIACQSDGKAIERLWEIVQHLDRNPRVREVFPHLRPLRDAEWSKHKITVERQARHRDASVEAMGITASVTGGRADLLVADDVVDRRNAIFMPGMRAAIKQAWKGDWSLILEPGSRCWYICTLWHKDDLSHDLMGNPAYHTLSYSIGADFASMWPAKWPEAVMRSLYAELGSVEFNRAFRNQALDQDSALVRQEWIRFADLQADPEFTGRLDKLVFFTSYDTATTVSTEGDYFAACIVAVDPDRRLVYVIDAWHGHLTVAKQADIVAEEIRRYQPFRVLIEKAGQATLDEWVINKYPETAGLIEVTHPRVSKAIRLAAVTPLMEAGSVIFSDHLDPDGGLWTPGRGSLVHELMEFPFGKHDDMVDAFSQALAGVRRYYLDVWAPGGDNDPVITFRVGGADPAHPY